MTLDRNVRQRNPAERAALAELRHGSVERAVDWYLGRGRTSLSTSRTEALAGMVDAWAADVDAGHDTARWPGAGTMSGTSTVSPGTYPGTLVGCRTGPVGPRRPPLRQGRPGRRPRPAPGPRPRDERTSHRHCCRRPHLTPRRRDEGRPLGGPRQKGDRRRPPRPRLTP